MALSIGQRVTLLRIDDCLAMTHRYELEVRSVVEPQPAAHDQRRQRVAAVRERGKRKDIFLDLADDDILLDGWDLPLRADTDGKGAIAGNACFNLIGEPAVIRECIETRAAWPISDDAKAKIIVARAEQMTSNSEGQLLYPEIETHHAVVNRMKED